MYSPSVNASRTQSLTSWKRTESIDSFSGIHLQTKEYNMDLMKEAIQRAEIVSQYNAIPYNQTFEVLSQIARESKYYIKCKLIDKLDQLIINIYMF